VSLKVPECALIAAMACLSACGGESEPPLGSPPSVTIIYGDPAETQLTPYPSDRYTVPGDTATGLSVDIPDSSPDLLNTTDQVAATLGEIEAMDGFSTTGGIVISFDGAIDITGIAPPADDDGTEAVELMDASAFTQATSPFILLDVDEDSPTRGEAVGLVPRYWAQPADDYYLDDEFTIIAQPATPLRPGTRYLFVVTDRMTAEDGSVVGRSELSDALLEGKVSGAYADQIADGLGQLDEALGVSANNLLLATSFTTASVTTEMLALAKWIRDEPATTVAQDWTVQTPTESDGRALFRATYAANEYRLPAPDGRFVIGADGIAEPQSSEELEVFMAVSNANTNEPRTAVIYGHGLAGDKDGVWGAADRLKSLNAAVFAIDSPHHGSRAAEGDGELDAVFKYFGIDDTDPDNPTFVIGRARDNFRQMAADQLELVRLIDSLATLDVLPEGNPDGVPDIDTSRILYIGHSFGAVQGATIFAIAPEITHATWNVGGAGLMTLLRDSTTFGLVVNGLRPDGVADGAVARFMAIAQGIVDPGDPLNFAPYALREQPEGVAGWVPREVLLQEVIADSIVPNSSTRALARATGLELIDPIATVSGLPTGSGPVTANLPQGVTGAMSQFDTINGGDLAIHGELYFSEEGRGQYVTFFETALSDTHATIPSGY
jgi:hypothetical protein